MPSRNILKYYVAESYYHVYSRGVNKQIIFNEESDYAYFISLFKRYLIPEIQINKKGAVYPNFGDKIKLVAFCLMPNHIHMFVYQIESDAMQGLMRAILTSYSGYFNRKYNRRGPLFESRYKASLIKDESYFSHISRYIHLNPKQWPTYPYSSIKYYTGKAKVGWINPDPILEMFTSAEEYIEFMNDYLDEKDALISLKQELAEL